MSCCSQIRGGLWLSSSGFIHLLGLPAGTEAALGSAGFRAWPSCFLLTLRLRAGGAGRWFFHLQAAFQLKEKWRGQMASFSLSVAITCTALLLWCSALCFSRSYFFKTVAVRQGILSLKIVENKNICQCDIMSASFLISCVDGSRCKCCLMNEQIQGQAIDARLPLRKGVVLQTWALEADCLGSGPDTTSYSCVMLSKFLKYFSICKMGTTGMPSS